MQPAACPKEKENHWTLPFVMPINMSHNPQLAAMTLCLTSGPAHCPQHCDVISAPWRLAFAGGDNRALDVRTGRGAGGGSRRGRCGLPEFLFCICTDSRGGWYCLSVRNELGFIQHWFAHASVCPI